ncbi:MAG TPA: RNA polymerase sigma factor [Acidimicrobiia bacterium]|nr:RNA polymerase sigma factor [Acidimicrobiia bacterium]
METDADRSTADAVPEPRDLAFEPFFAASCQTVVGLVAAVTGDTRLAEDATQEAYLRALRRWHRVRQLERPELWVARVASNLAIDRWRRQRRESGFDVEAPVDPPDSVSRLWVEWGLAQLTPAQRQVVLLKDLEGYPVKEIAGRLARSPETVKSQLASGRRRLRELLGDAGEEDR